MAAWTYRAALRTAHRTCSQWGSPHRRKGRQTRAVPRTVRRTSCQRGSRAGIEGTSSWASSEPGRFTPGRSASRLAAEPIPVNQSPAQTTTFVPAAEPILASHGDGHLRGPLRIRFVTPLAGAARCWCASWRSARLPASHHNRDIPCHRSWADARYSSASPPHYCRRLRVPSRRRFGSAGCPQDRSPTHSWRHFAKVCRSWVTSLHERDGALAHKRDGYRVGTDAMARGAAAACEALKRSTIGG